MVSSAVVPPSTDSSVATPLAQPTAHDVLAFWFVDGMAHDWPRADMSARWFGGASQDEPIRARFGALVEAALTGGLTEWETQLETRLALVILLDQLTRNVHRGTARAFAGDARAQRLVRATLAADEDAALPRVGRAFLYMPLMHAEDRETQDECVRRFAALLETTTPELSDTLTKNLRFAEKHRDIVASFGRFPYRNAVLRRTNTPEEEVFLKDGPRFGQ